MNKYHTLILKKIALDGAYKKSLIVDDFTLSRLDSEIETLEKLNLIQFYINNSKIITSSNNKGIIRSPGFWNACGSLINYCLDITKVNPIENNLIFERFINENTFKSLTIKIDIPFGQLDFFYEGLEKDSLSDVCQNKFEIREFKYLNSLEIISKQLDSKFHPYNLSLDNKDVFELFSNDNLDNIYEWDHKYLKPFLKEFKPNSINDLSILYALYRPNAIDYISNIIQNKSHGYVSDFQNDERINEILKQTYGIIVYQETFMQIANQIAGMEMKLADYYRSNLSELKNDQTTIEQFSIAFKNGCTNHSNLNGKEIERLTDMTLKSVLYSFCKSHSISYTTIGYWGAYYKTHFKILFDECFDNN